MDLTLPGHTNWPELDVMLRKTHQVWPAAVIESSNGLKAVRLSAALLKQTFAAHVFSLREFVIYENSTTFTYWERYGHTREFESAIILLEFDPTRITLTVDREDSGSAVVANAMLDAATAHRKRQDQSVNFWQGQTFVR